MHEILTLIQSYIRSAWRYRWIAMLVAWVISLAGWVYVQQLPDRFASSAKVFVDSRSILRPLLRGMAIQSDVNRQLGLMVRLLMTRENLKKIARMADLDLNAENASQMDAIVQRLKGQISITRGSGGGANIYRISCSDRDPRTAKRVVQSVLTLFVEGALGETRRDSDSAQRFIDKQVAEYKMRLEKAEHALKEFRRENYAFLPGKVGGYYSQLRQIEGKIRDIELTYREALQRRNELQRQLQDEEEGSDGFDVFSSDEAPAEDSQPSTRYDARIAALEAQKDELLLRYTRRHPSVVLIRDRLKDLRVLQAQKREEKAAYAAAHPEAVAATQVEDSPVVQQLKLNLSEASASLATLKIRKAEFERRRDALQANVDTALEVETRMKDLNRDYGVIKGNFNQFIAKRETAKLSEAMEQRTDNVKFKVIEPPKLPKEPSAPNRPLLLTGVLFAGLAVGIGVAILIALFRPTFDSRHALNEITGFPVLGSVSMNWTSEQSVRRRLQLAVYVLTGISLLGIYTGVLVIQLFKLDVSRYLEAVRGLLS